MDKYTKTNLILALLNIIFWSILGIIFNVIFFRVIYVIIVVFWIIELIIILKKY